MPRTILARLRLTVGAIYVIWGIGNIRKLYHTHSGVHFWMNALIARQAEKTVLANLEEA